MFKRILIIGALGCHCALRCAPTPAHRPGRGRPGGCPGTGLGCTRHTRVLAVRACFDCHSSETVWPWYSKIAPASWLLSKDVTEARNVFSFSSWKSGDISPERAARVVREREMPPSRYLMLHPEARLADAEIEALALGFLQSLK